MTTTRAAAPNDAQSIIQINGYAVSNQWEDNVERIRDVELAQRLEYAQPRMIRLLIERLRAAEKLNDLAQRYTVQRRADGMPSMRVKEFWLTEPQALKVIAKSETAKADAILDEVIAVFVAWRHGRLAPANTNGLAALATMIENHGKRIGFLEMHAAANGVISDASLKSLRDTVRNLAELEHAVGKWKSVPAARADIYRTCRAPPGGAERPSRGHWCLSTAHTRRWFSCGGGAPRSCAKPARAHKTARPSSTTCPTRRRPSARRTSTDWEAPRCQPMTTTARRSRTRSSTLSPKSYWPDCSDAWRSAGPSTLPSRLG